MKPIRTTVHIEHVTRRGELRSLADVPVNTSSLHTWAPRGMLEALRIAPERTRSFVTANGDVIERALGFVVVHAGGASAPDIVVFAEAGDAVVLGALSLSGLNLRVDPVRKILVDAGPVVAAVA